MGNQAADTATRILVALHPESSNEPDVVLLAARAYIELAQSDETQLGAGSELLHRLATLTVTESSAGWGLSYAWDAFGDGTTNSAETIYSYTTAAAGLTFVDAYDVTGDRKYLAIARSSLETLTSATCCWKSGRHASIWYSNAATDQTPGKQVHNVSGLTLALMMRLHELNVSIDEELAESLTDYLLDEQGPPWDVPEHAASTNWPYSATRKRANDLLHETFILEGMARHPLGRMVADAALDQLVEVHYIESGEPAAAVHTRGSLGWGPAAGLYLLAGNPRFTNESASIAEALNSTFSVDARTTLVPDDNARALAWYALALARFSAVSDGHTKLTAWHSDG